MREYHLFYCIADFVGFCDGLPDQFNGSATALPTNRDYLRGILYANGREAKEPLYDALRDVHILHGAVGQMGLALGNNPLLQHYVIRKE